MNNMMIFNYLFLKKKAKEAGFTKIPQQALLTMLPGFGSANPVVNFISASNSIKGEKAKRESSELTVEVNDITTKAADLINLEAEVPKDKLQTKFKELKPATKNKLLLKLNDAVKPTIK